MSRTTRHGAPLALAFALTATLAAGAAAQDPTPAPTPAPSFAAAPGAVTLVAYSTPREAYEEIIPLFAATEAGAGVAFETSYGASGDQSRAVEAGLPGDILALSLAPDVDRLIEPGIVAPDWAATLTNGMIHASVVVLVVRSGNPKRIAGWDDLLREDVSVVTPNPFTSGGAQWNVLAAYGAQIAAGKTEEEAIAWLAELFRHVPVLDKSAREALQTFVAGQGDVLISYENEAIIAQQKGEAFEYIIPDATVLIENPIALTLTGDAPEQARAFLDFLYTPEAQRVFGAKGFRPIVPEILAEFSYPTPPQLFTIADFGGWAEFRPRFFDKDTGVVAEILRGQGIEP